MNVVFIIFIICASLSCLSTVTWIVRDIVLDELDRKRALAGTPAAVFEEEPVSVIPEEPIPEPEIIEENVEIPETVVTSIIVEKDTPEVEVVDVVWAEDIGKHKTYRYAPNGFEVKKGEIVLVPTMIAGKQAEIARKATVASEVYSIDPAELRFKLKPILRVVNEEKASNY